MAKQYSTKEFFRQMSNHLLARYFKEKSLFGDLDFGAMKEGKPDKLFESWLSLPDALRNQLDAEFRDIYALCSEKGFIAILDEARWQLREKPEEVLIIIEKLSMSPNHYERAMVTFLEHHDFWNGASRFYHADTLSYWRKRKNLPKAPAAVDDASIEELANLIRNYFHHKEGRGKNCIVEPFRRGDLDYFFCYPEDHSQKSIEWVDGKFDPRPHNPAFEIVYIYSQKEGTLDLNFRGSRKAIKPLQDMFAIAILKLDELPPDPQDERVYDLNPLRFENFNFVYEVGSVIQRVAVKKMRFSSRIKSGDRITVEADPTEDVGAINKLIEQANQSIPLHLYNVTQVELAVSVKVDIDKPEKTVTIRIAYPNSCSLKYDGLDFKLRDMLEASGIEPKEPDSKTDADTTDH